MEVRKNSIHLQVNKTALKTAGKYFLLQESDRVPLMSDAPARVRFSEDFRGMLRQSMGNVQNDRESLDNWAAVHYTSPIPAQPVGGDIVARR